MEAPLHLFDDPLRPPDWRWRAARAWVDMERNGDRSSADPSYLDGAIRLAVRFLRERRRGRSPAQRARAGARMPVMGTVYNIATAEPHLREAIEVRMLASQAETVIAATSGVDVRSVYLFGALFFDISDRLNCIDFICSRVLVRPVHDDPAAQRGSAIRMLAWAGGPSIADQLLSGGAPLWPTETTGRPADPHCFLAEAALAIHKQNLVLAQVLQRLGPDEVRQLTRLYAETEIGRATPTELDPARKALNALFQSLRVFAPSEFDSPPPGKPESESAKYRKTSVEPRAAEYWKLARGEPVPELEGKIERALQDRTERDAEQVKAHQR